MNDTIKRKIKESRGEEFKSCRKHLYEHLDGNAAWRYGSKENCRSRRKKPENTDHENEVERSEDVVDTTDMDDCDIPWISITVIL